VKLTFLDLSYSYTRKKRGGDREGDWSSQPLGRTLLKKKRKRDKDWYVVALLGHRPRRRRKRKKRKGERSGDPAGWGDGRKGGGKRFESWGRLDAFRMGRLERALGEVLDSKKKGRGVFGYYFSLNGGGGQKVVSERSKTD